MHLLADISAHGFGHLAQTAPVLDELVGRIPHLRLTVRCALPRETLDDRIRAEFHHVREARDFGFVMDNAVDIDVAASARRYQQAHLDWPERVAEEAEWLQRYGVDAVLANIAYLPLAGAARAGIPGVAICSLNWADLMAHYFATEPWTPGVHAQIRAAYASAHSFLRLTPGLPTTWHPRVESVGTVAPPASPDRGRIARELDLNLSDRWVLVAMGGMDFPLEVDKWPVLDGVTWLVASELPEDRDDVRRFSRSGRRFSNLLVSVDAVITKPGYGTFVEAACGGIPILWLERDDWPETPYFAEWLAHHARSARISRGQLASGDFIDPLRRLWQAPVPPPPVADGAWRAAARLHELFGGPA